MNRVRCHFTAFSALCLAAVVGYSAEARAQVNDVAVQAVPTPADLSCGQTLHALDVQVVNLGTAAQFNIPVQAVLTGDINLTLNGSIPGPLLQNQFVVLPLGSINTYGGANINLTVSTMLASDEDTSNDMLVETRYIKPIEIATDVQASCPGEPAVIVVQSEPLASFELYDEPTGGTLLASGDMLTTPPIDAPTTFWIQRINGRVNGGEVDNSLGMGGPYATVTDGLVFDVSEPIVLETVHVYPSTPGQVQITIRNSSNNIIGSSPVFEAQLSDVDMKTAIPVGLSLPAGTNYKITAEGTNIPLYRNYENAVFPYPVGSWAEITGNGAAVPDAYYFFYDWEISQDVQVCSTERTAVQVGVNLSTCAADLAVSITGPETTQPGAIVEYVTTVTNAGPNIAYSSIVHVPTPEGYSHLQSSGDCTNPYPCGLGHMGPGESAVITARYIVNEDFEGDSVELNALVNTGSIEANPGDENATIVTIVEQTAGVGGGGGEGGAGGDDTSVTTGNSSSGSGGGDAGDDGGCRASAGPAPSGPSNGLAALLLGGLFLAGARRRRRRR